MSMQPFKNNKVDPNDPVPFRILAEHNLNDVGWNKSHTNFVATLLQKLYHTCPSTKIDIDEFWANYINDLNKEISK